MNIELSFITVNYNGLKDTCELIDSIPFNDTMEVIVVDNASKNDDVTTLQERYPHVKLIRSPKNLGFAGGNNLGIQAAKGKYLFLINNDTILKGSEQEKLKALQDLTEFLAKNEKAAVVCPKIRFAWGANPVQFAGYTPLSPITMRNRSIGFGEEDKGQFDACRQTPYAHGAAMLVRREAVEKVGMMPECYFLYYEELDWSMMFSRAGYEIWYNPVCTIYHKESQSTGQNSPLRTYYITRNRMLFVKRNVGGLRKYASYAYLIGLVATRDGIKYTLTGNLALLKATIKGISDFLKPSKQK